MCQHSEDVSECWKELALQLDLPSETINTLDIDYGRTKDKCYHMFDTWLKISPDPCWCGIVGALKVIKMSSLATDIDAEYLGKSLICCTTKYCVTTNVEYLYSSLSLDTYSVHNLAMGYMVVHHSDTPMITSNTYISDIGLSALNYINNGHNSVDFLNVFITI